MLFCVLCILFQRVTYCDMYPMTNYTMEIKQFFSGSDVQTLNFRSATNHIVVNDLLENEIYKFRMTAWNSVGSVSSDAVDVCKLALIHALSVDRHWRRKIICIGGHYTFMGVQF